MLIAFEFADARSAGYELPATEKRKGMRAPFTNYFLEPDADLLRALRHSMLPKPFGKQKRQAVKGKP